jgi:hypothetical protein
VTVTVAVSVTVTATVTVAVSVAVTVTGLVDSMRRQGAVQLQQAVVVFAACHYFRMCMCGHPSVGLVTLLAGFTLLCAACGGNAQNETQGRVSCDRAVDQWTGLAAAGAASVTVTVTVAVSVIVTVRL